jgi:hypothetical protein
MATGAMSAAKEKLASKTKTERTISVAHFIVPIPICKRQYMLQQVACGFYLLSRNTYDVRYAMHAPMPPAYGALPPMLANSVTVMGRFIQIS